jgi:branched-chain amino acid transport system ATP-binding protein
LSFGGVHAVAGVDITVHEREIYAIIGPNGAGQTSFFNALSGYFLSWTPGSVTFRGERHHAHAPNYKRVQLGMSRTFQTPSVFPELTVEENLSRRRAQPDVARRTGSRSWEIAARHRGRARSTSCWGS